MVRILWFARNHHSAHLGQFIFHLIGIDRDVTVISWSEEVLNQLDNATRSHFPCILTSKYACDVKVVRLPRQRGYSISAVMKQVSEQHEESYLNDLQFYLFNCREFKASSERGFAARLEFSEPPPYTAVPRHRWFLKMSWTALITSKPT